MGIVAPSIPSFLQAGASAQEILKLLRPNTTNGGNGDGKTGLTPKDVKGELVLEEVSFSYPERPSVTIFDHFSLRVPAGKVTAVVGYSGSGNSTIVSLLQRWYNLNEGKIYLDGRDTQELDLKWLRGQIGLVQQVGV